MGLVYIYLHEWLILVVNVGKYTSPMDCLGHVLYSYIFSKIYHSHVFFFGGGGVETEQKVWLALKSLVFDTTFSWTLSGFSIHNWFWYPKKGPKSFVEQEGLIQ